jgi:hypothetical protein
MSQTTDPPSPPVKLDEAVAEGLIRRYVQLDRRGRHRAYVVWDDGYVPIWPLAGYLRYGGTVEQAAADYHLPLEVAMAAIAYYQRNRDLFDAWLLLNEEGGEA